MKGKCPEWGKVLVKGVGPIDAYETSSVQVRCPSCRKHYHQLSELEWSE